MIGYLIGFSARNRLLVVLGTLMLTGIGIWSLINTPLDALPDLSDTQVIVYTDYPGQAPQVVEDQVTYPLATALLAVPHAKVVRGFSNFAPSSMSCSRTAPIFIGRAAACSNISILPPSACPRA
jgi:Cu(I)/Ag(I) efflux system membrane protein CusA/SilA